MMDEVEFLLCFACFEERRGGGREREKKKD
jgi:hypothetical protein